MTEDELDAKVAKLFNGVVIEVKTVNGKISDQATIEQMEREEAARRMEEACGMFLTAERRFQKLCEHPDKVTDPKVNVAWWESLEQVYEHEKAVWAALRRTAADHGGQQALRQVSRPFAERQQPQGERMNLTEHA